MSNAERHVDNYFHEKRPFVFFLSQLKPIRSNCLQKTIIYSSLIVLSWKCLAGRSSSLFVFTYIYLKDFTPWFYSSIPLLDSIPSFLPASSAFSLTSLPFVHPLQLNSLLFLHQKQSLCTNANWWAPTMANPTARSASRPPPDSNVPSAPVAVRSRRRAALRSRPSVHRRGLIWWVVHVPLEPKFVSCKKLRTKIQIKSIDLWSKDSFWFALS